MPVPSIRFLGALLVAHVLLAPAAISTTPTPATTEAPAPVVRAIYALPADVEDAGLVEDGSIARSVQAMQGWLAAQTGGRTLPFLMEEGALVIETFRLEDTDAHIRETNEFVRDHIEAELVEAGYPQEDIVYAVYYGGTSVYGCGGGAWPPVLPGTVAALYLHGEFDAESEDVPACATHPLGADPETPGYLEFAMLHAIMNTIGVVPECARNHVGGGGVGDDPADLMYVGELDWEPTTLDVGNDDYYDHRRADCFDLKWSPWLVPYDAGLARPEIGEFGDIGIYVPGTPAFVAALALGALALVRPRSGR